MALQVAEGDETHCGTPLDTPSGVERPFVDVGSPSFRFDDPRLHAARTQGLLPDSIYGPVVCDHATVGRLLRQPTLVHDPWRQLRCSGVRDHAIGSWFASLLIFSRADDHDVLRQRMRPLLRGPAFDPSFAAAEALAATAGVDGACEFVTDVADAIVDAQAARLLDVDRAARAGLPRPAGAQGGRRGGRAPGLDAPGCRSSSGSSRTV
ncbi:MAG: hypothetical protein JF597_15925 [Streptomyces sp.]|uniref:hypothetical protein n=1 Tax=Streptomyces sp. TaxID=1931 RepID=UPI0025EA149C|nr:hypothetical protein [Streptomyces sp.]MBW8795031.1 hypothetical protein [Streptomyces sp.]